MAKKPVHLLTLEQLARRREMDRTRYHSRPPSSKELARRQEKWRRRKARPDFAHKRWRWQYRISREDVNRLLQSQAGRCACCGEPLVYMTIDHDHACCPGDRACGACVRGLLCRRCNTLLGMAGDSVRVLSNALSYLNAWKSERSLGSA